MNREKIREVLEVYGRKVARLCGSPPCWDEKQWSEEEVARDAALAAIEAELPRWIKCSERLPSNLGILYPVCGMYEGIKFLGMARLDERQGKPELNLQAPSWARSSGITGWFELPPQPETEEGEDA